MASSSKTSTNHEEIRKWAEERGGRPSCVRRTGGKTDVGILRINFPGFSGETSLDEITWEDWFEKFDQNNLALLFQETTKDGEKSNFNKIVSRQTAEAAGKRTSSTSRTSRTKSEASTRGSGSKSSGANSSTRAKSGTKSSSTKSSSTKSSSTKSTSTKSKASTKK